jgi:hypothetical protein
MYFYTREKNSISAEKQGLNIKMEPSDMVLKNIFNYSRALEVLKGKSSGGTDKIHIILN